LELALTGLNQDQLVPMRNKETILSYVKFRMLKDWVSQDKCVISLRSENCRSFSAVRIFRTATKTDLVKAVSRKRRHCVWDEEDRERVHQTVLQMAEGWWRGILARSQMDKVQEIEKALRAAWYSTFLISDMPVTA